MNRRPVLPGQEVYPERNSVTLAGVNERAAPQIDVLTAETFFRGFCMRFLNTALILVSAIGLTGCIVEPPAPAAATAAARLPAPAPATCRLWPAAAAGLLSRTGFRSALDDATGAGGWRSHQHVGHIAHDPRRRRPRQGPGRSRQIPTALRYQLARA